MSHGVFSLAIVSGKYLRMYPPEATISDGTPELFLILGGFHADWSERMELERPHNFEFWPVNLSLPLVMW
jgi:hypothetical protein